MSHEHRTIILPLKLVELACSIVAEAWARLLPPTDESEALRHLLVALREAVDPDADAATWSRISAALGLPDDRPTLEAVAEALEGSAPHSALDELRRFRTATQAALDLDGDPTASECIAALIKHSGAWVPAEKVDVLTFSNRAEVQSRSVNAANGGTLGEIHVLTWTVVCADIQPERGETVYAGGKAYVVEAPGLATRFEVEDIPF